MTRSTRNTLCRSKHALRSTPNPSETGNAMATPTTAKEPGRQARPATDPAGPTGRLATWVARTTLDDVPASVRDRAKHLVLDGVACALVGAQLPLSRIGLARATAREHGGDGALNGCGEP